MGSTRLSGKVLADVCGRPVLWYVVSRLQRTALVDEVVVATSDQPADDAIAAWCAREGLACFRGSEDDVLKRYYEAASAFEADVIVRITADCPLIDPHVVDKVIAAYLDGGADYVANILRCTYPDGLDTEVFSSAALERTHREAIRPADREHVTPYMRHSGNFRIRNVTHDTDLSRENHRWVIDDAADLAFFRALAEFFDGEVPLQMEEIRRVLRDHPEIRSLNQSGIRNAGYYRSLVDEPPIPAAARSLVRSAELTARAERVIPSLTQTFSKGPTQYVRGVAPVFLVRGQGSHVWDVDGNEYIDYPMALGPVILGHDYPAVSDAVMQQMRDGTTFSLPHPLEVGVAELLVQVIPCAEMVRFGKNGSDVTSGAVRVARAYTGRDLIACCGYHGWQDWYVGTTTRHRGVPAAVRKLTIPFRYNDMPSLQEIFRTHPRQVAAVILEPMGVVEPQDGFLEAAADLARAEGAVLIFDEVVTGFRIAMGGAQELFGVVPDLACVGKAMANGYPLAAVVGRRDIMELFDEVFFSFTFGGETLSLAAATATVTEMQRKNVIGHLWEQGRKLQDGYRTLAAEYGLQPYTDCIGLPPRTVITFQDETRTESLVLKSLFQQECLKRGVLFSGGQNLCYSHSDADIDYTLRVYRTALEILRDAIVSGNPAARLEGPPVQPVFREA